LVGVLSAWGLSRNRVHSLERASQKGGEGPSRGDIHRVYLGGNAKQKNQGTGDQKGMVEGTIVLCVGASTTPGMNPPSSSQGRPRKGERGGGGVEIATRANWS